MITYDVAKKLVIQAKELKPIIKRFEIQIDDSLVQMLMNEEFTMYIDFPESTHKLVIAEIHDKYSSEWVVNYYNERVLSFRRK